MSKQYESSASVSYGQKRDAQGNIYAIHNWDGARDFTIVFEGEVTHGTACEEWVGWKLAQRERYLDQAFGKGEWSWG